jgi:TPR repeat protein
VFGNLPEYEPGTVLIEVPGRFWLRPAVSLQFSKGKCTKLLYGDRTSSDVRDMSTGISPAALLSAFLMSLACPFGLAQQGVVPENLRLTEAQAVSGDPIAQTRLADHFRDQKQYTNAILWYRLAAQDGDVNAQLGLAGLYVAGRGVAEDRVQAAFWLRRAADALENSRLEPKSRATVGKTPAHGGSKSIIITKQNEVSPTSGTAASQRATAPAGAGSENLFTNAVSRSTREPRVDNLVIVEPELQDPSTTPKTTGGSR